MKIVNFSDLHGQWRNLELLFEQVSLADLYIANGDLTHFGNQDETVNFVDLMNTVNKEWFAITGNCDLSEMEELLRTNNKGLHSVIKQYKGLSFCGVSGSLPCPVKTPGEYSEAELSTTLQELSNGLITFKNSVFVSHQPPLNTLSDRLPNGQHVGSVQLKRFIEKLQPSLFLTGHIHEGRSIDKVGDCTIVNPGSLAEGNYAIINYHEGCWSVSLEQLD